MAKRKKEPELVDPGLPEKKAAPEPPPQLPPPPRAPMAVGPLPVIVPEPIGDLDIVNNLVAREILDPAGPEIAPDPTLSVLGEIVVGLVTGSDLTAVKTEIERIISHQTEKAEIVNAVIRNHHYYREFGWLQVQAEQERAIWKASKRGDVSTSESIALLRMASAALSECRATRSKTSGVQIDGAAAIERVEGTQAKTEQQVAEAYQHTTPHGREIIRKRIYALQRQIAASKSPIQP